MFSVFFVVVVGDSSHSLFDCCFGYGGGYPDEYLFVEGFGDDVVSAVFEVFVTVCRFDMGWDWLFGEGCEGL